MIGHMARIVIDARNINSTTGRYAERLIHYLEELDHTNHYQIVVPAKDQNYYKPRQPNFTIVTNDTPWYSLAEQLPFRRFLENLQPDLVHFCMPHAPVRFSRPHIVTVHDLILLNTYNSDKNYVLFKAKQFIGRFVFASYARSARHILCPTHYVKDAYAAFARINPDKITVTYEGCDIGLIQPKQYDQLVGKQFLLYVGQQSDYKNIRRLVHAHQKLRQKYPDLLLVFIGKLSGKNGPPLVRNKEWVSEQGYKGVIYTDFLPDEQLRWCLSHCAAYVFPSLMEGFGLPGLEAMASRAPVVSSNATCLPEVYGDAAEYFDPLNTNDMTAAIERVLQNSNKRQELIARGLKQVAKYSWRDMAEQTFATYQHVLSLESQKTD